MLKYLNTFRPVLKGTCTSFLVLVGIFLFSFFFFGSDLGIKDADIALEQRSPQQDQKCGGVSTQKCKVVSF
jgi:hypothetical protein